MIQTFKDKPSTAQQFAKAFSAAGQTAAEKVPLELMRREENKALHERGIDLSKIYDPQTRAAILASDLQKGLQRQQSNASFGLSESGRENANPKDLGSVNGVNQPQQGQSASSSQLLSPEQIEQKINQIHESESRNGLYRDRDEIAASVQRQEAVKEKELLKQESYGNLAIEALNKVYPDASDETQAVIRKKVQQAAKGTSNDADIRRIAAVEARNLKNRIASIQKSVPKRFGQRIKENFLGTSKKAEIERESVKRKIQPLINEGLYDEARALLSGNGYSPEEVESTVSSLGENTKKLINQYEDQTRTLHKVFPGIKPEQLPPEQQQVFQESLNSILKADPAVNLILLRKQFEDKGVDWRSFQEGISKALQEGVAKLDNNDQINAMDMLEQPPLNELQKILYGLNLIGR